MIIRMQFRFWLWSGLVALGLGSSCTHPTFPPVLSAAVTRPAAWVASPMPAITAWPSQRASLPEQPLGGEPTLWPLTTASATPAQPATLIIPMLALTRTITPVPVNQTGWDVTNLDDAVGWLTGTGEQPGAAWAMAFTAHASRQNGTAGPFGYLWRVPLQAEIMYQWGNTTHVYQVVDKRWIAPGDTRAVFIADGNALLLVTCDGWNFLDQTYTQRLLVVAQQVNGR